MKFYIILFLSLLGLLACKENPNTGKADLSESNFRRYLSTLASDDFQGRKPFTPGEQKTVSFLTEEAKRIGLSPGNGDSFTQDVPLTEITGHPDSTLDLMGANQVSLHLGTEYVGYTQRSEEQISISGSDVVFCGFGVTAPEADWDDYAGTDVTGKTVILLVNDPDYGTSDSTRFKGKSMTYYGRWTYKYEAAARRGAAAVFIVHETNAAGYPWNVVREASTGSKLNLQNLPYTPCLMQGWISTEAAEKIFTAADLDFKKAKIAAQRPGFKAIPLPFKANVKLHNEIKNNVSKNVIAVLPGTDKKDEYIIFSAHWDHFGISTPVNGDSIYNGAVDNASGSAALLAIAEAMKAGCPYQRTIVFLWVTAEEQGLLGSAYYAAHPVFPPAKTVADLNIDALNDFGVMKDLSIVGYGQSELEDYAKVWAEKQGRYILPDQEPEKGYFFRSDHFNFAKIGIPALFASGEHDQKEKGIEFAKAREEDYRTHRYHQPADEYHGDSFDVSGMLQDATLYMEVAAELANNGEWPKWKPGSEFKAIREKGN